MGKAPQSATHRRWLRYSLRTLLGLMLLASVAMAWLAGKVKEARQQAAVVAQIRAAGGTVYYDYQEVEFWSTRVVDANVEPQGHALLRRILGNDFFDTVIEVDFGRRHWIDARGVSCTRDRETRTTDRDIALVEQLPEVGRVVVIGGQVTDDGLRRLATLKRLESVQIDGTKVSVEGAQAFAASRPGCRVHFRGDDSGWLARTWPN
ncbi:MAG: hypothetical protein HYS13_08175 [Planctomycetia bacterium]|nr:hypothetical protein [Planctomycetia bacterium]